jgi:hypothetical protein
MLIFFTAIKRLTKDKKAPIIKGEITLFTKIFNAEKITIIANEVIKNKDNILGKLGLKKSICIGIKGLKNFKTIIEIIANTIKTLLPIRLYKRTNKNL